MSFYLYAETAFHHEGSVEYLFQLIDEAKKSNAHGIKFQVLINLNEFMSSLHSAYADVEKWVLSFDEWEKVFKYTQQCGLDIILMPLDTKAFEFVKLFNIKYIEIHSVSFKDEKLLRYLEKTDVPLIFGIGGRTLKELDVIVERYHQKSLVLMVGFQSYPSDLVDIKLQRISYLKKRYPQCVIGYADHSSYSDDMAVSSNEYAYMLGARVFEKHITIDEGNERVDFQSAVGLKKLIEIRKRLEYLEKLLSVDRTMIFEMSEKEEVYRNRQKVPVSTKDFKKGTYIREEMITLKMVDEQDVIELKENIVGKTLRSDIKKDQAFTKEI